MSDDDYEAVLGGFIADLKRALRAAGSPSYGQIEQKSARLHAHTGPVKLIVLAHSTTQEILTGHRTHPPKWHWVVSFITVLQVIARESRLPVDSIGTIDEWKRRHETVCAAAEAAAKRPAGVGGRHRKPADDECASDVRPTTDLVPPQPAAAQQQTGCGEPVVHGEVLPLLRQADGMQWWLSYRDIAPQWLECFLALEAAAEAVRTYEPRLIPGLLQIEAYARATLERRRPDATAGEITRLVELRMRRQDRLRAQDPFQLWAIVDEAVLRSEQVGKQTARSQIAHLINISEQPGVTIQVLRSPGPNDAVAIKEPITIFRFPKKHLDDAVVLEQPGDYVFLTDRPQVEHYSRLLSRLSMRATVRDDARDLLREIFAEL